LLVLLCIPCSAQTATDGFRPVSVGWIDGQEHLHLRGYAQGKLVYLSLQDLTEVLGAGRDENYLVLQVTLSVGSDRILLTLDSPFVSLNGKIWNMGNPVKFMHDEWAVPARLVTVLLPGVLGKKIAWNDADTSFRLRDERLPAEAGPPRNWAERGRKIRTVVVDAGHGGIDPGAIGPGGLQEKTLNLDLAFRLRDLLESRLGVDVILTRQDDTFIPLHRRTEIATCS
jgi:N-acetylmuramoyl-L-alanine amidase